MIVPTFDELATMSVTLHDAVAAWFAHRWGLWRLSPEVSFSVYGERGIIDVLAWHPKTKILLVIELKTEVRIATWHDIAYKLCDRSGTDTKFEDYIVIVGHDPLQHLGRQLWREHFRWSDDGWMAMRRESGESLDRPMSIYEVHLGSWRRSQDPGHRLLSYSEL